MCAFLTLSQFAVCCGRVVLCSQLYLIALQPDRGRKKERGPKPVLVLAAMEPGNLQPLILYNEHTPCAHGHPQQPFGVSKEVIGERGKVGESGDAGGDARGHPWVHSAGSVVPPHCA